MAKKVKFESFVYRFLAEADAVRRSLPETRQEAWKEFVRGLRFSHASGSAVLTWSGAKAGSLTFSLRDPVLYRRGDTEAYVVKQRESNLIGGEDQIARDNAFYFRNALMQAAQMAGVDALTATSKADELEATRLALEESFHDQWASTEDLSTVDIRRISEACTSPELRYIRARLDPLKGKAVLDVGCGLGEASVYFAMEGASVTAMDLSQGMLDATARLARANGVTVRTHKAAAERTNLPADELFDVIYAGNLLHHVDIETTLRILKPHLRPDGVFVSWDPLAYNPIINVYRAIATAVRTPDEHPLRWKDIRLFRREFKYVVTKYFWLTTLLIFIIMALVDRRNPNKERFWKSVVTESDRWQPLYRPLSKLDEVVLALIPPLRLLCWNVVIVAGNVTIRS